VRNEPARKIPRTLQLIEQLEKDGVDTSEDHEVEHFFVGSADHATAVAELFGEGGYTVSKALNSQSEQDFSVLLSQPIDGKTITRSIIDACQIAEARDLGYDGWDVDVSRWKLKGEG